MNWKSTVLLGAGMLACVVLSNLLFRSLSARGSGRAERAAASASDPKLDGLLRKVSELEQRLALEEVRRRVIDSAPVPSSKPGAEPVSEEGPAEAEPEPFENLNQVVTTRFEAQASDGSSLAVERAVVSDFEGKQVVLSSAKCRKSICRLDVLTPNASARQELDNLLGSGALAHGAFTFAKPDGTGTIVFIGTPTEPLTLASLGISH
jgi:hypothetical protein